MRGAAAGIPAARPRAGRFGVQPDRLAHVRGLLGLGKLLVIDPLQAVAGDVPVGLAHGRDDFRIARECGGYPEYGHRHVPRGEQAPEPPEAGARAVLEHRLDVHVALAGPRRRAEHVRQEGFGGLVAVQDRILAAFFEVHHELHGDAGLARPAWIGRRAAIASEVARVIG